MRRAAALSALVVIATATAALIASNFCWVYVHGASAAILLTGLLWLDGFLFFLMRFRGRAILVACTIALYLALPYRDAISPTVMAQVEAVGEVQRTNAVLESYRRDHPQEGYPSAIPEISSAHHVERFYRFTYKPLKSRRQGPFDNYLLMATPIRPRCGCVVRYASSADGRIHSTTQDRSATIKDKVVE